MHSIITTFVYDVKSNYFRLSSTGQNYFNYQLAKGKKENPMFSTSCRTSQEITECTLLIVRRYTLMNFIIAWCNYRDAIITSNYYFICYIMIVINIKLNMHIKGRKKCSTHYYIIKAIWWLYTKLWRKAFIRKVLYAQ